MSKRFGLLFAGFSVMFAGSAYASPSFDCAKANTPVEQFICSSPEISKMDNALAAQWKETLGTYEESKRPALIKGQKAWLKIRKHACQNDAANVPWAQLTNCLTSLYNQRIDMLKSQQIAHAHFPQVDFDALLDDTVNLTDYSQKTMGTMGYNGGNDRYLPETCRQLYSYEAGNWAYTSDAAGKASDSYAQATCGFNIMSKLSTTSITKAQEQKTISKMKSAVKSIKDGAKTHEIKQFAIGDFTGGGRQEILAIVTSASGETQHFFTLYLGYFIKGGKFKIEAVNPDAIFEVETGK